MKPHAHQSLFIDPPSFDSEKTADFKLSDNCAKWDEEIISHINEEIPFLAQVPFEIVFKNLDKELGYAQGGVRLNIPDVQATVPLIIKKRRLAALDTLMVGKDHVFPLTEENLMSLLQKKQAMGKLKRKSSEGRVDHYMQASHEGLDPQSTPGYGKYAERIVSAYKDDMAAFHETLQENMSYQAGFKANGTVTSLEKIAKLVTVDPTPKALNQQSKVAGMVLDKIDMGFEPLTKTGGAIVVDRKQGAVTGVFIHDVETLAGEKLAHSLFIGKDVYGYQEKMAGKSYSAPIEATSSFDMGDDICFVKTSGVALEPIQILSKMTTPDGIKLAARTHFGETIRLQFSEKIASIQKIAGGYLIPKSLGIVKLGKRIHPLQEDDVLQKMAMAKISPNLTFLKFSGDNYQFENEKVGSFHGMNAVELTAKLKPFYSNAEELVKTAENRGRVIISGVTDSQAMKVASVPTPVKLGWNDRIKLAAALSDPDSVDAILGLGFVNEENIQAFIQMLPDMQDCVNGLAKILVMIRLGLKGDENATKMAMKYLQRVIDSLKGLQ
jgi:hypothetical protein